MRVILFCCFPFVCVGLATTVGGCWCDRHCCFLVLHLDDKALRLSPRAFNTSRSSKSRMSPHVCRNNGCSWKIFFFWPSGMRKWQKKNWWTFFALWILWCLVCIRQFEVTVGRMMARWTRCVCPLWTLNCWKLYVGVGPVRPWDLIIWKPSL